MDLALLALFTTATLEFNLPPRLLESICFVESSYRPNMIHEDDGNGSSVGVCQVQLRTAAYLGYRGTERGLLGPGTNVFYAAKYLRYQYDRYGDWQKAVGAYNAGVYRPSVNQSYIDKVFKVYCGSTGIPKDALIPNAGGVGNKCQNHPRLSVSNPTRSN